MRAGKLKPSLADLRKLHIKRERSQVSKIGKRIWRQLIERYGERCMGCGATDDLSLDHILPVSRGGRTELGNMQILCKVCNWAKGNQIIDYRSHLG